MDAFYASAEQLRHREYQNRPVIVGGSGNRGVVAAASYEARFFGVRSAMSSLVAKRRCPQAVFLKPDLAYYKHLSEQIMAIMLEFTPLVEPLSLDEAFLDVTGRFRHGTALEIAHEIRTEIFNRVRLSCSAGVATSKFLAKLASEAAKPIATKDGRKPGLGVFEVCPGSETNFLAPLPVTSIWGVGPATDKKLQSLGVFLISDLARRSEKDLVELLGQAKGRQLFELAHGIDERPVEPGRAAVSISQEETFRHDRYSENELRVELLAMCDAVVMRSNADGRDPKTVTLKVKFSNFKTVTRSKTLSEPVVDALTLFEVASNLVKKLDLSHGVRLLGVGVTGFKTAGASGTTGPDGLAHQIDGGRLDSSPLKRNAVDDSLRKAEQLQLFPDSDLIKDEVALAAAEAERNSKELAIRRKATQQAVEEIRKKFGVRAIGASSLLEQIDQNETDEGKDPSKQRSRIKTSLENENRWGR